MITRFEVRNYKSIKHVALSMRPFMVFVGPNGAGKTNLVAALQLFGDILYRGTTDPVREQGWDQVIRREKKPARGGLGFVVELEVPAPIVERAERVAPPPSRRIRRPVTVTASLDLTGAVDDDAVGVRREQLTLRAAGTARPFTVTFEASRGVTLDPGDNSRLAELLMSRPASALEKWFGTNEEALDRGLLRVLNWLRFHTPLMRTIADLCRVDRLRLDASALRADTPLKEATGAPLGVSGEGLAWAVDRLESRHKASFGRVLAALQRVYPRIEDVRPHRSQPGRFVLYFKERGISEQLGPLNVSDGVLHALALLITLEGHNRSSRILAIEEPENAIHPWSVRSMIDRAQEVADRQIIMTTHSDTVVNAVRDPADLYLVDVGSEGTVVAQAPDREQAIQAILNESGQKLGEVWLGGTLGGVPGTEP